MVGQIVAEVTPGETYLVQPFEEDGTARDGQRLVHVVTMLENSPALGFYFYDTIKDALAAKPNLPSVELRKAVDLTTEPERPVRKTLDREPRELATPAAPAPVVPPPAPTSPALAEEGSLAEDEGDEGKHDPERALESLRVLVGQHGIVAVRPGTMVGNKLELVVEVNGDTSEAQMAVPERAFGVKINVRSVTLPKNGVDKPTAAAPVDDRPF